LVNRAKTLNPDKWWYKEAGSGKAFKIIHSTKSKYVWEGIYTTGAYKRTETATGKPNWSAIPPVSTPWEYWHAYYLDKAELIEKGVITSSQTESLWYNGMYKDTER
jgi:hypothetical protein